MTTPLTPDASAARERAADLIQSGRHAEAESVLAGVLETAPDDRVSLSLLGMARFRGGDVEGAERTYRALVEAHPDDADGLYALATTLLRRGREDEAIPLLDATLRARPGHTAAARRLATLRGGTWGPDEDGSSLAQLLDRRSPGPLDDTTLAGELRWSSRPFPVAVVPAALTGAALVALAPLVRAVTEALPAGPLRGVGATIWRLAAAAGWPAAGVCLAVGVVAWLTTHYVVRAHRLEVTRGVLVRRFVTLWFHDIERQPVVEQNLAEQLVGLGSVRIVTDALLLSRSSRRTRLGELEVRGLTLGQAQALAAVVREATLVERRRMIANFISTR